MDTPPFQWDPNKTQTYNIPQDLPLPGPASAFDKARGTNFTMDSDGHTLTLQIAPGDSNTFWSTGDGSGQTLIDVKNGTFIYDAVTNKNVITSLWFVDDFRTDLIKTVVTVENHGQLIVKGDSGNDSGRVIIAGILGLSISVSDYGLVDMTASIAFNFSGSDITLAQQGRLSMVTPGDLIVQDSTVNVSSAPASGYSLNCVATGGYPLAFPETSISFSAASTGLLKAQNFLMRKTNISAADTATCNLQFDAIEIQENAVQFILGPGKATMQFDGYSSGTYPFDFINGDPKTRYPQGMFNFTSKGTVNGGEFLIRVRSAFEANAIVSNGFVAIDGDVQTALGRVNATFDSAKQQATITQIKA